MADWAEPVPQQISPEFQIVVGGHPLVSQILQRRGLDRTETARAFLDPDLYRPTSPSQLPDLDKSVQRLVQAIERGERICVWGDFDVDGQTATTILVSTLQELGAQVDFHIPVRATESHGVNLPVLKRLIEEGAQLLLTCDTGISAHETVDYAKNQGVDTLITDHHELPSVLPQAYAVVNPKMLPGDHTLRELPGVGCAYKLVQALYDRAGDSQRAAQHLDLVALGIVADVAVLKADTRYLLQRGLECLRHTSRAGLRELIKLAELTPEGLTEQHIGFSLAPRLNALGRLADANSAVELLTTSDLTRARILATEMEGLNARRKLLVDQILAAVRSRIEKDPALLKDAALVVSHPSWPPGVIGIVASRLVERYNRPVVLLAAPKGKAARGSARSVEGVDITAAISTQSRLLLGYGGHPMAAGLSIDPENIPEFRRDLSRCVADMLSAKPARPTLALDALMSLRDLDLELVQQMERLAPFGPGNPAPILCTKNLRLQSRVAIGRYEEHLQLVVEDEHEKSQKVMWWHGADWPLPKGPFDLAYRIHASNFRGKTELQLEWVDSREVQQPTVELEPARPRINIVDLRAETDPDAALAKLPDRSQIQMWNDGPAANQAGRNRLQLEPSPALAIWTVPPGPAELKTALQTVQPQTLYLFGVDPGLDQFQDFIKHIAGLVKYTLRAHQGQVDIPALAAASAQRESTVILGLEWLQSRGQVTILESDHEVINLAPGQQQIMENTQDVAARLKQALTETAAFRAYYLRASTDIIGEMAAL